MRSTRTGEWPDQAGLKSSCEQHTRETPRPSRDVAKCTGSTMNGGVAIITGRPPSAQRSTRGLGVPRRRAAPRRASLRRLPIRAAGPPRSCHGRFAFVGFSPAAVLRRNRSVVTARWRTSRSTVSRTRQKRRSARRTSVRSCERHLDAANAAGTAQRHAGRQPTPPGRSRPADPALRFSTPYGRSHHAPSHVPPPWQ